MYTIKQAAIRSGVNVPLLRAWERRYGIPAPGRTASGYRLYDDESIDRVRLMKSLLEAGWAPSQAARAILDGTAGDRPVAREGKTVEGTVVGPVDASVMGAVDGPAPGAESSAASLAAKTPAPDETFWLVLRFLGSARALDDSGMEAALSQALALLGVDEALDRFMMPALVEVGEAWARGELTVAAEHAASSAVMRRLAALYEAAATPSSQVDCLIGLPPGSRHEIGALAFAVACRRAGLRVLYLGADLPVESWLAAAREHPGAAVVLGVQTAADAGPAADLTAALRSEHPEALLAAGGAGRSHIDDRGGSLMILPEGLRSGAGALAARIGMR